MRITLKENENGGGSSGMPAEEILSAEALTEILGFRPHDMQLYLQAFVHKSATRESGTESYEKLEFLGDSTLNYLVTRHLLDLFQDKDEGWLTRTRSRIVSGPTLASISSQLGLYKYILLSDKALSKRYQHSKRLQEDVLEALVAAVLIDGGLLAAKSFVHKAMKYLDWDDILVCHNHKDQLMRCVVIITLSLLRTELTHRNKTKNTLCRYTQKLHIDLPTYTVLESGPPKFVVQASIQGSSPFVGEGKTKKIAEQEAAMGIITALGVADDLRQD